MAITPENLTQTQDPTVWAKARIGAFLAKNVREFRYQTWQAPIGKSIYGGCMTFSRTEGTVCTQDDQFVLVKVGPKEFRVIAQHMLAEPLSTGAKVALIPFEFLDFSGLPSDGRDDPQEIPGLISRALTGVKTEFPVLWEGRHSIRSCLVRQHWSELHNPYLRDMIEQMECLRLDGRNGADILVAAGAKNLSFVDPSYEDSCSEDRTRWPSVEVDLHSQTFSGRLAIRYDRGDDTYSIDTISDGHGAQRNGLCFDDLLPQLADMVDDGRWAKVRHIVIKPAPKVKS